MPPSTITNKLCSYRLHTRFTISPLASFSVTEQFSANKLLSDDSLNLLSSKELQISFTTIAARAFELPVGWPSAGCEFHGLENAGPAPEFGS